MTPGLPNNKFRTLIARKENLDPYKIEEKSRKPTYLQIPNNNRRMSQMPRKSKTPHLIRRRETVHSLSSSSYLGKKSQKNDQEIENEKSDSVQRKHQIDLDFRSRVLKNQFENQTAKKLSLTNVSKAKKNIDFQDQKKNEERDQKYMRTPNYSYKEIIGYELFEGFKAV